MFQGSGARGQGTEKKSDFQMHSPWRPKFYYLNPERCTLNPVKGFTLIELMVSASILGMIGLVILTTFASGFHVFERVQAYGGLQADILLSLEEMERDLGSTFAFTGMAFEGEAKRITFPAVIEVVEVIEDEEAIASSVGQISYYLKGDTDQKILMRDEWNYSQAAAKNKSEDDRSGFFIYVKDLEFSYYSVDEETREGSWEESWAEEEALPAAVKIKLTYEDRGGDIELIRTVLVPAVQIPGEVEESEEDGEEEGEDEA
jgi:prepilin-type N-terminal cleavage/methylation domain-containing protein